jgi:hypothetical protein
MFGASTKTTIAYCYKFSKDEVADPRFKCLGCSVNVIEAGDFCMLNADIWQDQLHLGWEDNMCIACIEVRIGRKLGPMLPDFAGFPSVKGYPMSDILRDRLYGDLLKKRGSNRRKPTGRKQPVAKRKARAK